MSNGKNSVVQGKGTVAQPTVQGTVVNTTGKRDNKAPAILSITVTGADGKVWGIVPAITKDFSTGSKGYYASDKISNPDNPEARYQCGLTFTLIGSKG